MKVSLNQSNCLRIETEKVREYVELFDDFGDEDIVQASEIHPDYIAYEGMLFSLDVKDCRLLMSLGVVVLPLVGKVIDCGDEDFINWYF